ncbi:MAG: OmpA family protein [Pseudomonadota bacterium]
MSLRRWVLPAALAVQGCAGEVDDFATGRAWDVDAAAETPAPENPFLAAMHGAYIEHARFEAAEPDWISVADYVQRIRQISLGTAPAIRDPRAMGIDAELADEMSPIRNQILALQADRGAMLRAGAEIGTAQAQFDCWAEQADEGHQSDDILRCRDATLEAVETAREAAKLPSSWVVVLPEEDGTIGGISLGAGDDQILLDQANAAARTDGTVSALPVDPGEIAATFEAASAARPLPAKRFTLTFESGSARISDTAFEQILAASQDVRRRNAAGQAVEVLIAGHADAVGDDGVNLALSRRRAASVARAVENELRREEGAVFSVTGRGERQLAVPTPDTEERNRRVVVLVR